MTALILGFFASSWFGWAQERPPAGWRPALIFGSAFGLAVAAVGAVYAWLNRAGASALNEPGAMRWYAIIVGLEFGFAAVGAAVLGLRGPREYLAPWICLVVGVHFWPMAPLLKNPALHLLGAALVAVAGTAVFVARRSKVAPSAVTGLGAGATLLGFAIWGAIAAIAAIT